MRIVPVQSLRARVCVTRLFEFWFVERVAQLGLTFLIVEAFRFSRLNARVTRPRTLQFTSVEALNDQVRYSYSCKPVALDKQRGK